MSDQETLSLTINQIVGENIRKHRKRQRLTMAELAEKVAIGSSSISSLELGKRNPRLENLAEIAHELEIPLSYLFEGWLFEEGDTLYVQLEQKYDYLRKKHERLLLEMEQFMQRLTRK